MSVDLTVVELSTTEFDVLWEAEGLPPRPTVLDVPSPGRTRTERAQLVNRTLRSLAVRGLAEPTRTGLRAAPELAELLAALAAASRAVDVRLWANRHVRALAAAGGDTAALALVDRDRLVMRSASTESLTGVAVSIIGDRPAGGGHSVSVPHDTLTAADRAAAGDPRRLGQELTGRGVERDDARTLAGMCAGMTVRGQFGAETADGAGRRRRAGKVVAFHEAARGRYLHTTSYGDDGRRWSTITPADLRRITATVAELLASVS